MAIDPYSPCPGGTGKKVKFCCPDLMSELEKLEQMLEGEQQRACLDRIDHLLSTKFPGRACLLTTKSLLERALGQEATAQATVKTLLEHMPDNAIGLAEMALLEAQEKGAHAGIDLMQQALAAAGDSISPTIYSLIGELAERLLHEDHLLAGRALLNLMLALRPDDEPPLRLLLSIQGSRQISPLLKNEWSILPAPPEAAWKADLDQAVSAAGHLHWREAETRLKDLAERVPTAAAAWFDLAMVRGWLADEGGMAQALHRYALLDAPLDRAVEAEALAQLYDPACFDAVERLRLTFPIRDLEPLLTTLAVEKRAMRAEVNPAAWVEENQAPPRNVYRLLDRPVPETGVGLTLESVPNFVALALVYGRQTDREARLEVETLRRDVEAVRSWLLGLVPEALGEPSEEVVAQEQLVTVLATPDWRLPQDTPPSAIRDLLTAQRRHFVLEVWPATKLKLFEGRSPHEVASDSSQRIRLLAAVLRLEISFEAADTAALVNELRAKLGLPQAGPIEPAEADIDYLPLVRLNRLVLEHLSDEQLQTVYEHAVVSALASAGRRFGEEILRRPALATKLGADQIHGMLANMEADPDRRLEHLLQARQAAVAAGRSCANWDMREFTLRVQRGEAEAAGELLQHLQARHGREPGVRRALMQMLYEAGMLGPAGAEPAELGPPGLEPGTGVEAAGAAAPSGKLWTPGSEAAPGKKSALWTPGMD